MKYLILVLIFLGMGLVHAAIYQQTDSEGNIVYSDTPLDANSKVIDFPLANQAQFIKQPESAPITGPLQKPTAATPVIQTSYTTFLVDSPRDQETIQNQRVISVVLKVEPELQLTDLVQLYVDGKAWGQPQKNLNFDLVDVERGTHQLSAALLGNQGQILAKSNSVTIFVHRASVNSINANTVKQ